jgi:hypothetical protein
LRRARGAGVDHVAHVERGIDREGTIMNAKYLAPLALCIGALAMGRDAHASCKVDFPNSGFLCIEDLFTEGDDGKQSIGFGQFVGPQSDLVLNVAINSLSGLFGGCIAPLDINGNQISECLVCDGDLSSGDAGEEVTCETNVFPFDLELNQS